MNLSQIRGGFPDVWTAYKPLTGETNSPQRAVFRSRWPSASSRSRMMGTMGVGATFQDCWASTLSGTSSLLAAARSPVVLAMTY